MEVNAIKIGPKLMTAFFRDITEKRKSEESLVASEEKYRLIAENSTDMIARHDSEGTILYVSPVCETLLGYLPQELIGKSPYDFCSSGRSGNRKESLQFHNEQHSENIHCRLPVPKKKWKLCLV